ncbi:DeoR/GlpR family transcriptional regulator [Streptomyces sp. YC504]|uniref:DeoR/GlpR family transcriptional regulator n=1 Tax=Streptomyces mesophilus TaxID=1775132 RepID=A0A6G4XBZ5_9ACTN|nr:substrate-binding domain-containing protein [Streptomyces mesophilus]NGO74763.1 DeoR/GlpR family transcriptional regulator [Streptomyces mesophilus]
MRFTVDERHQRILELVRAHGTLRVAELADHLGISTVTARRDAETLASAGKLDRVRGSVSWPGTPPTGARRTVLDRTPTAAAPGDGPLIGLLVPQPQHYFAEIIRGVTDAVREAGGRLILGFSAYAPGQDDAQAARLLEAGAEGLLLTPGWMYDGTEAAASQLIFDVPAVLLERRPAAGTQAAEMDHVCSDHYAGAGLAVRHLVARGHRDIALLSGLSAPGTQVRAGYLAALHSAGIEQPPIEPIELYVGAIDHDRLMQAAKQLLDAVTGGKVSAALVLSDDDAIVLLQMLRTLEPRIEVPKDLALVAYGDDVAALSDQPLTAVAPPKNEVGRAAVELLLRRLREVREGAEPAPRTHLTLLPRLRVRRSCGTA